MQRVDNYFKYTKNRGCLEYRNPYCNFRFSCMGTHTPSTGNWRVAKNGM